MNYLLDSDRVADFLKGRRDAVNLVSSLAEEGFSISVITFGEVLDGIYYGRDPDRALAAFERFIDQVPVLTVGRSIARRFARIRGYLRSRGLLIPDPDILIAATALEHDHELVIRNLRHFERVPGLRIYRAEPAST